MKAVRFDEYGGVEVLKVVDVPCPLPGPQQVLVRVKAAGINPGEAKIRDGLLHARWPATFPSGQGSDLAGIVAETGPGVPGFSEGDEVIGFTDVRASQAEYVIVEQENLTAKPAGVDPGRLDADQHLLRSWQGARNVHHLEDFDPAVLVEPHCLHRMTSITARASLRGHHHAGLSYPRPQFSHGRR